MEGKMQDVLDESRTAKHYGLATLISVVIGFGGLILLLLKL